MATKAVTTKVSSAPTRHVYDVIVLGGQLGGALAAALLAKRGYKVLLIEHDGLGQGYEHDGFLLPFAPFVAPPIKALGSLDEAFAELGLATSLSRMLRPHVPELQVVLPDHRLDLSMSDEARRLAELTREFGAAPAEASNAAMKSLAAFHEAGDAFFRQPLELPADGFMETWGLKSLVKKAPQLSTAAPVLPAEGPSQALLDLVPFLTYLETPEQPLAMARALSQALAQPSRFPNGREGFRELLTKKLQDLGGDLLTQDNSKHFIAEELAFEGDRVVGIKLVQNETVYRAATFIAATDAGALRRLVPDKKKHRKLVDLLDLSTTRKFLFTLNWVVPVDVMPRGMGELLLLHSIEDLGPVLVQVLSARRVGKPDDDSLRVVCAGAFVPASARELGEPHLRGLADRLGSQLEELMPFTRPHVKLVSAPYLDAGSMRGSRLLPHPLFAFEPGVERVLGVEGLSQRTGTKNLFLANREVLPGLGLEGELLSAIRAARLVQESSKKHDPLK